MKPPIYRACPRCMRPNTFHVRHDENGFYATCEHCGLDTIYYQDRDELCNDIAQGRKVDLEEFVLSLL